MRRSDTYITRLAYFSAKKAQKRKSSRKLKRHIKKKNKCIRFLVIPPISELEKQI